MDNWFIRAVLAYIDWRPFGINVSRIITWGSLLSAGLLAGAILGMSV